MRPGKASRNVQALRTCSGARLDQIVNLKHALVRLAGEIDWVWIDAELAGCFSAVGRPGLTTRFMVGLFF
jgi:IS5 family transposase